MLNLEARIAIHLVSALAAGALIGLERSYHGRPAGFRTHALVCLASSMLMLVSLYQSNWHPGSAAAGVRLDPTRMAQGIMTGIGFLGAGVIMKEGLSVRGLTTAASIWLTAAVGILYGIGLYFAAVLATALALGVLSLFRWIERKIPVRHHARCILTFPLNHPMPEQQLRDLFLRHQVKASSLGYKIDAAADEFEYRVVLRAWHQRDIRELVHNMRAEKSLLKLNLHVIGD